MNKRNLWINEDNGHFYFEHSADDMTKTGLERLVDYYAEDTQVAGILFCVNVQRALFDSKVWEPLYHDYIPDGAPDQPCLAWLPPDSRVVKIGDHGRQWVHNLWLLKQRGLDHPAIWLNRCRHHGIEGWLTMRMNDCHYNQEAPTAFWHSTLWKTRPDLYRAAYREERSWERAFDYAKAEVRQHHLKLIQELFDRYSMDGLELDWLRWGMNFTPGHEAAGRKILTGFMREVRRFAEDSAGKFGHPVKIGVRVPAEPQACLALGYDVPAWAKEGLIDQVVLSGMGNAMNFNYPVGLWRMLLGNSIHLLALSEDIVKADPFSQWVRHDELWYGGAASALQRGIDGLYFFNSCYMETKEPRRSRFRRILQTIGDSVKISRVRRRHAVSYPEFNASGEGNPQILPIPLLLPKTGMDIMRMETTFGVRVQLGRIPAGGKAVLHMGVSPGTPLFTEKDATCWINGRELLKYEGAEVSAVEDNMAWNGTRGWTAEHKKCVNRFLRYVVPPAILHDDVNAVEWRPPQVAGQLRWVEVQFIPEDRKE